MMQTKAVLERMVSRDKGLTLFEVLMVFVVLGFILYMVSPSLTLSMERVREIGLEADIKRIEAAVQLYYLDTKVFPQKLEDLWQRPYEESDWKGPYLNSNTLVLPKEGYLIGNQGRVFINNN